MKIGEAARRTYHEFNDDDVLTYAAALAFHAILALFPFLLFLLALVTFLDVPILFERLMSWSRTVLPPQGAQVVADVVQNFQGGEDVGLLSLGVIGAIWAASGGVRSAINALNNAYDVVEKRPAWRRYVVSVGFTIAAGILVLLALGLLLVGPRTMQWLSEQLGLPEAVTAVWPWLRLPMAAALLVVVASVVYSVLPNVKGVRFISIGSVIAVGVWILLSLGFQFYLSNFGNYDALYGSIGAVIILLLYFWLSAIVLLVGGEINAVLHAGEAEQGDP